MQYLIDLEKPFDAGASRPYDPVALVRFALTGSTYWAGLALVWLESGAPAKSVIQELRTFKSEQDRPQAQRHNARRLRKAVEE